MLPSLHSQFVYVGIEPVEDFEAALSLDSGARALGSPGRLPADAPTGPRSDTPSSCAGISMSSGATGSTSIVYDELPRRHRSAPIARRVRFLGVNTGFEPTIEVVNPNKRVRSRTLRRFVRRPPEWLRPAIHRITSERIRRRAGRAMIRLNTNVDSRTPLSQAARAELQPEASREADELEALLGIDLGAGATDGLRTPGLSPEAARRSPLRPARRRLPAPSPRVAGGVAHLRSSA